MILKSSQKYLQSLTHKIAKEHDHRSFRQLFNYYYEKLFRVAFHFVKSEYLAEEVISELFINLWKKRNDLTHIRNIDAFLYYSAKNKSIDYLRKMKKSKVVPIEFARETSGPNRDDPEAMMIEDEFRSKVNASVMSLPPKCQLIYRMVKEDGLKYGEVADLLEISVKTVEFHMGNALKKLRKDLSAYISAKQERNHLDKTGINMALVAAFLSF